MALPRQFQGGFSWKDEITAGFTRAVETAYKAVMKPKEGTILTVAKGMADKAEELVDEDMDVIEFCEAIVAYGYEVLSKRRICFLY